MRRFGECIEKISSHHDYEIEPFGWLANGRVREGLMTNKEIYDRFAAKIERFFTNKAISRQDVGDLLHRTFVRFFAIRARGRMVRQPLGFLYGIANNVLHEYWREKGRVAQHEDIGEHSVASLEAGASTLLGQREDRRLLHESLREVKLDYQVVLELFYWENKTYEQIAEFLEVSVGTVGTRLRRGRKALALVIEHKWAQEGRRATRAGPPTRSTRPPHSESIHSGSRSSFGRTRSTSSDRSSSSWPR